MPRAALLLLAFLAIALAPLSNDAATADDPPITALLNRYASGDFNAVVAILDSRHSLQSTLEDLESRGPALD